MSLSRPLLLPLLSTPQVESLSSAVFVTFLDTLLAISEETGKKPEDIDIVTGIIVPQPCVNFFEGAVTIRPAEAIFFIDCSGILRFVRSYRNIPSGVKMGVCLQDALKTDPSSFPYDSERDGATMEIYSKKSLRFVVHWPGCRRTTPFTVQRQTRWSPYRIAHDVARAMSHFYEGYSSHVEGRPDPDWDIGSGKVPFEKLYLLELRAVGKNIFQPVLSYDAD